MAEDDFEIIVEGKSYTAEDLSFREQREMRTIARQLMGDPEADMSDAALIDLVPALVYVVVRRDKPDFTLDEALDLKMGDVVKETNGNGGPPTQARARRKTKATT